MRKMVLASLASMALVSASPALAGKSNKSVLTSVDDCSMECDGPATVGSETTIGFTEAGLAADMFTEWLTFTNDMAGVYSLTLDTSSAGIDFTSAIITGPGGPYELDENVDNGTVEFWSLSNLFLEAGTYTLTITGDNNSTGSLGGTVTINAVPEPGTWAMMLLGFGAAGYAMRRRRAPALAQVA
jgi:PEP-CTERM motif